MSDNTLRIRLEFKNFKTSELKSLWFVYKKKENDCVQQLSQLIKQRFNIKHSISLFIDNFLLQNDETIEAVRDNDLIVVQPENQSEPKNETKPKPRSVSTAINIEKSDKPKDNKSLTGKRRSNKSIDDSIESTHSTKNSNKRQKIESSNILNEKSKCVDTNSQQTDATIKIKTEINEDSNELNDDSIDIYSNRNTPLRKAFKAATKCLSEREPPKPVNPSKAPIRKRLTREAREPVDKFSPIIPLKDLKSVQQYNHLFQELKELTEINGNKIRKKQSARKSFPTPPNNNSVITPITTTTTSTTTSTATTATTTTSTTINTGNTNSNNVNNIAKEDQKVNETLEMESNSNDFSDCEPLGELPNIGDLIAFKILTQSKTTGFPEASKFQKGSVINRSSNMIDILIENDNNNDINDTNIDIADRRVQILKIDWSTILEPKIIQRQHLLLSDSS